METGNRKTPEGEPIPRNIIHTLTATLAGKKVFRAELGPGIAANPYLAFHVRAAPGTLEIAWRDDRGQEGIERVTLAPG
jgi:sulfur-oxidizing protein SoxZ